MAIDAHSVETYLLGQLVLFGVWLAKELWRIYRDQSRKNSEDIGAIKIQQAKIQQDMNAAWERIRLLEKSPAKACEQSADK